MWTKNYFRWYFSRLALGIGVIAMDGVYPSVLDLIERFETLSASDEVWQCFMEFTSRRGLCFGALADLPRPTERLADTILCLSWPGEWLERYMNQNYLRRDPAVRAMSHTRDPYSWNEALEFEDFDRPARRIVDEAAEFGMRDGFVVPILGIASGMAVVTVAGTNVELSTRERAEVHLAAIYAHARVRTLYTGKRRPVPRPAFSPRERECLQWAAAGKTDWEIGEILSITERTARAHIDSAKHKCGVPTRIQAIVSALQSGAICV